MEQNPRQVNNKLKLFRLFNFAGDDFTVSHFHDKRMLNSISKHARSLRNDNTIYTLPSVGMVGGGEGRGLGDILRKPGPSCSKAG